MMVKGQVVGGELGKVCIRQKSGSHLEIGELLICGDDAQKILLQVFDLTYGSQISQQNLELISGMKLEDGTDISFFDEKVRNYTLASAKPVAIIQRSGVQLCKRLPNFFGEVRQVEEKDLDFMTAPPNPLFIGKLRSGSKMLDVPISLPGDKVFSHHVLITSTTGRGKSNLVKVMLWSAVDKGYCGVVVLDPHDEYYGRNGDGLKSHTSRDKVEYYTPRDPPPGAKTLKINIKQVKPEHFSGAASFSDAQSQAMGAYYREYGNRWVESVVLEKPLKVDFHEATVGVLKRRLMQLLDLDFDGSQLFCRGVFDLNSGETTVKDIASAAEQAKTIIVDTSGFSGAVEIMIGSMITTEIFRRYRKYKAKGALDSKPVVSVVIEEAPRVLGKEVLESGPNIFSTIAREGRKFKVGLTAITQLPSLIPREVLANMNTKIILGIEMKPERQAIIESASQDLSTDDRNIASLDKGEAIVTSNFVRFATPIKVPLFGQHIKADKAGDGKPADSSDQSFEGVSFS
ncbi:ATP-binding protein [Candidatus Woesearchaeota archaeon]|nr:ATP-binding protein [Candidatus Woesearchaeota archaeon]